MTNKTIQTEFGTVKLSYWGYYYISSSKEGNHNKKLHRLIWEKHYGKQVPEGYVIHHINGTKTDNRIQNLICVPKKIHTAFHMKHRVVTDEMRKKISETEKGKEIQDESRLKISKAQNTSGYYRVSKCKDKQCKQGFRWRYQFKEKGKQYVLYSVDLDKLKEKVLAKNWIWGTLEEVEEAIQ